jgi:prevent-host-death family protein
MAFRIPEIHPISDLARDARSIVDRVRQRQEPIVITQRGREVAVLVPIELYRKMEGLSAHKIVSPRLVHPEDAEKFRMRMTTVKSAQEGTDADV